MLIGMLCLHHDLALWRGLIRGPQDTTTGRAPLPMAGAWLHAEHPRPTALDLLLLLLQERLGEVVGVAHNRLRLSTDALGFLRDELSLAHYNLSPDVQLQLGVKERGGRKK